jgi:glutamate racemase
LAPAHIAIVDSAESTAENVAQQLECQLKLAHGPSSAVGGRAGLSSSSSSSSLKFFATDSAEKFRKMGTRFLGLPVEDVVHVDLKE